MNPATAIWLNGQAAQSLSALDRGLAYGHGVFETMRICDGQAPLLSYHLQRLHQGLQALHIDMASEVIAKQLCAFLAEQAAAGFVAGVVKIIVTAGSGGRGYQLPSAKQATANVILQWHPLPDTVPTSINTPLNVRLCNHRLAENTALAGIKHLNRLDQVLARAEWTDPTIDEGIVLDQQGRVVEAVASNLFIRRDNQWLTPALNRCGVAGIMRRVVMEQLCPALQMPVVEKDITLDELISAQEVFLCNSVLGIRPVGHIIATVDYPIGDWCTELHRALSESYPCYE